MPFLRCSVVNYRQRIRLGKPYTEFHLVVTSPALHWDAYKRYSEFQEMHKAVSELVHDDPRLKAWLKAERVRLPRLPPSKLVGNMKNNFLHTRMAALHTYIGELLSIQQLDTCRPVLEFLGALESTRGEAVVSPKSGSDGLDGADNNGGAKRSAGSMPRLHLDAVVPLLDAGDVVLFRTNGVLQGLQRTFTGSRYDHVGIVIRIPCQQQQSTIRGPPARRASECHGNSRISSHLAALFCFCACDTQGAPRSHPLYICWRVPLTEFARTNWLVGCAHGT